MVFLAFLAFSVSEEEESSRSKVGEEGENERSPALEGLGSLIFPLLAYFAPRALFFLTH